jgi:chaperonin GroEL (HSP60 family)
VTPTGPMNPIAACTWTWLMPPSWYSIGEAKSLETELEVVEGMQFDRGYISPYFVTNADKMRVDMDDVYILISEKKLSGLQELLFRTGLIPAEFDLTP